MKKLSIRLINSKIAFFLITTTIILSLNLTPLILQFHHAPPGRTFALIHNNAQDFFFYQSLMNEGANGDRLTSDPYTTEPHQSSVIFSYFLWLGKLGKVLGLPYAITYHLVRILLSLFFLFTIYYLLFTISIPSPRLTFFFFLFASPLMHQISDYGKISTVPYMYWWTGMDAMRRVAYLPHHMFGGLFLVISIILIIKFIKETKLKYLIWLIFIAGLLAFVHTPSLLIILLILPIALFIYLLNSYFPTVPTKFSIFNFQKFKIKNYIGLPVYWLISFFFLLLMVSQTQRGFPWSQYIGWERKLQFPLDRELIGALGVLFPLAIIGIVKTFFSKRFDYILIACWFAIPLLIIPFASKLNLSNIRLIQGVPYLPLAILATLGLSSLEKILFSIILPVISNIKNQKSKIHIKNKIDDISRSSVKFSKRTHGTVDYENVKEEVADKRKNFMDRIAMESTYIVSKKILHASEIGIRLVVLITFIVFTYPTLTFSLKDQIREYWPIFGNVYLDNRLYNAFAFINQNFPAKTITLSTFYTGNYLPSFTHTVSFIGHFGYTHNIEEKQVQVRKFFENKMSDAEAKEFLLNKKIALIFQGPEEKPIYNNYLYPKILKPVYDREEATIYTPNF